MAVISITGKGVKAIATAFHDQLTEKWTHEEAGWYTHPAYGGVVFETAESAPEIMGPRRGWWWYGKRGQWRGPFDSATEAMDNAHGWGP